MGRGVGLNKREIGFGRIREKRVKKALERERDHLTAKLQDHCKRINHMPL